MLVYFCYLSLNHIIETFNIDENSDLMSYTDFIL